ncbi:hypothetical protein [Micromonospora sp. NPDC050200]|uniref:hypothetical protein n=1 Tax=Micromonospora sp. NPDC050200 TaxID=3155664 RepID=UPI0034072A22
MGVDLVDLGLLSNIHEIWTASGHTYGADRVYRNYAATASTSAATCRAVDGRPGLAGRVPAAWLARRLNPPGPERRRRRIWSTGSSPRPARTGCGSPTRPESRETKVFWFAAVRVDWRGQHRGDRLA